MNPKKILALQLAGQGEVVSGEKARTKDTEVKEVFGFG
jgi:hypothetical protein